MDKIVIISIRIVNEPIEALESTQIKEALS